MLPYQNYPKLTQLQNKNLMLVSKVRQLNYLEIENEKLRTALSFTKQNNIEVVGTEIIFFDPSTFRRLLTVNSGKNNGIKKGAYVINENGYLVGKIIDVKDSYSYVMLIADADFSLPVFIGTHAQGLLKGALSGVEILYIEEPDGIKVEDKIWIKLANTTLPIYIGKVKNIRKDANSLFLGVNAELFAKNPRLDKLFIVR